MPAVTGAGPGGQRAIAGSSTRREKQRGRPTQRRTRLEGLPHDLLTRIASALPADGKKALRATCRLLRDATSPAISCIELTPEFDQALLAADRRQAACLHLGASFPAITSVTIHPPLARTGTLVHKILRQLPNASSIKLLADTSTSQRLTLRPLALCPALPSTLRSLRIDTLHTCIAPLSQLTALTYIMVHVPCKHPASLLAPLAHLTQLHSCSLHFQLESDPTLRAERHPTLLFPLASLASLHTLEFQQFTMPGQDPGHSLTPFTHLTNLAVTSNCPTTINSVRDLTGLRFLLVGCLTAGPHLWQAGPRPSFPNLTTLIAPLHLVCSPGAPHAPALGIFLSCVGVGATTYMASSSTFTAALSNVSLATLVILQLPLPAPHEAHACLRLLSGPAAPLLKILMLRCDERHLADSVLLTQNLSLLPSSLHDFTLEFKVTLKTREDSVVKAQVAALADMRLYGHLPYLINLRVGFID